MTNKKNAPEETPSRKKEKPGKRHKAGWRGTGNASRTRKAKATAAPADKPLALGEGIAANHGARAIQPRREVTYGEDPIDGHWIGLDEEANTSDHKSEVSTTP